MYYRGFKIRVYPNKEQEVLAWKHIGACRYIWNYMLDLQQSLYKDGNKLVSAFSMMKLLKDLKQDGEHGWLSEVDNSSLKLVCQNLEIAYRRFFGNITGFPKHKTKKKSRPRFPVRGENTAFYFVDRKYLHIPRLGKVRYKTDYDIPIGRKSCKFYNVHMFYEANKWFVSFSMECDNQVPQLTDKIIGIDLGVKELATVAIDGEQVVYHNINKSKKMRELVKEQKRLQRSISRKYEKNRDGFVYYKTNNIIKEEDKLRKVYRRIKNIRDNYIHQVTHDIVSMLPKRVVMEDLNVEDMVSDHKLARSVQDECFCKFRLYMRYKCERNGIEFVLADRFYPSSKTCSRCGNVKKIGLSERVYVCCECGLVIDRDFNAALNLSRYTA